MALTGKQRRTLRGLGHALRPVVQIGKEGSTSTVREAIDRALSDHELVKLKILKNADAERDDLAESLAMAAGAEVAQILGGTVLLYRARPRGDKRPRIVLP